MESLKTKPEVALLSVISQHVGQVSLGSEQINLGNNVGHFIEFAIKAGNESGDINLLPPPPPRLSHKVGGESGDK